MSSRPLFILAPPRSFTSVICGMIGQHPEMYGLPEVNVFSADHYAGLNTGVYRMRPGFRHGLLRAVAELGLGGQTTENIEAARMWLEEHSEVPSGQIFSDLASWAAPRRLVDKSPIYVYSTESLERIGNAFPDASYMHLTRHPRSTCESMFKLRERVQEGLQVLKDRFAWETPARFQRIAEVEDPESMWLKPHERIMTFLEGIPPERQLRLMGEQFMTSPDTFLPKVCAWLGIRSDAEAITAMKHPERSPFACVGPTNARFGNDPSYLESPELRPYHPKPQSFDGPIEGGHGDVRLSENVKAFARELGYGDSA